MKRLLATLLALLVVASGTAYTVWEKWSTPLTVPDEGFTLLVERGDSLRSVTSRLEAQGVLEFPSLLIAFGRWTGLDQKIKQGEYQISPPITAEQLLVLLSKGEVVHYQLTLPEGITLREAIAILHRQPVLKAELSGVDDERLTKLVAPHTSAEGLFLPETYRFERGDSDLDVLRRAHRALNATLAKEWESRAKGVPYETPYEAIIMASIIERETGQVSERPEIAGVFTRRLHKGMLLQTDPTIIYGLGASFDGNLRKRHLRDAANPYNTYKHAGLPPTPIALPGAAAINAALNPAEGKTLFFVARGDGGHQFSETLAEHNIAVRKYQLRRVKDYRSTPN
ncbi:MAG: endolytic transglycosylase MltG [Halioglobus sp.]